MLEITSEFSDGSVPRSSFFLLLHRGFGRLNSHRCILFAGDEDVGAGERAKVATEQSTKLAQESRRNKATFVLAVRLQNVVGYRH